jgi:hypothetical protein
MRSSWVCEGPTARSGTSEPLVVLLVFTFLPNSAGSSGSCPPFQSAAMVLSWRSSSRTAFFFFEAKAIISRR